MSRVNILGVPVDNLTMEEAVRWIEERIDGFVAGEVSPTVVVTPNPEMVVLARDVKEFRQILVEADLLVPDGVGLLLAGRILGKPLKERVSGIDLFHNLLPLAIRKDYKIYLLGAAPDVIQRAVRRLLQDYPGLPVVGYHHGYLDREGEEAVLEEISQKKPDILFVGMGVPRQEKFMTGYRDVLQVPVSIGIGGTFDVLAGEKKRAPQWVQRLYLEWLYRFLQEPRRLFRLLALPRFLWLILNDRIRRKARG